MASARSDNLEASNTPDGVVSAVVPILTTTLRRVEAHRRRAAVGHDRRDPPRRTHGAPGHHPVILVTVIGHVRVHDRRRYLFDRVFDEVHEFELLQRHPAVGEPLTPQQLVDAEYLGGAMLLVHPLRGVAGADLAAGHDQHGDAVTGGHMLCQRTAAPELDIVGMGPHCQYRSPRHAPWPSLC